MPAYGTGHTQIAEPGFPQAVWSGTEAVAAGDSSVAVYIRPRCVGEGNYFSTRLGWDTDPGAFVISVQMSDIDAEGEYFEVGQITDADLSGAFVGRNQFTGQVGRFIRANLVSITNASAKPSLKLFS